MTKKKKKKTTNSTAAASSSSTSSKGGKTAGTVAMALSNGDPYVYCIYSLALPACIL
jgi:hypothetical protein